MNKIKYCFSSKKERITKLTDIARKARLFVPGWMMYSYYTNQYLRDTISKLSIAYDEENPVGCAIFIPSDRHYDIMVFVNRKYRRRGIGSKLVKLVSPKDSIVRVFKGNLTYDKYRKVFFDKAIGPENYIDPYYDR